MLGLPRISAAKQAADYIGGGRLQPDQLALPFKL